MKKLAIVDLKGGLGNQIFQLAYALYLKSINLQTLVDLHFFDLDHPFPRNLEIDPSLFDLKSIKLRNNKIFFHLNTHFQEDNTFSEKDFKVFNRFVGYYQNLEYLNISNELFRRKLSLSSNKMDCNLVAVHIRKTDYLKIRQNLNDDYYVESIKKILEFNNNLKFDIYTDDESFIPNKHIYKNINNFYKPDKNKSPLEVLQALSCYKNYIIANSTFSLLAAYFSDFEEKKVFYPSPWFRNSNIQITNIPKHWIKIENNG